jgi:hypothetical protein
VVKPVYRPSSIPEHVLQFPVVAKAVGEGADRMTDVSDEDVVGKVLMVVEAFVTTAAVTTGCQESASVFELKERCVDSVDSADSADNDRQ